MLMYFSCYKGFDLVEENITNAAAPTKLVSIKESIKDYEDIKCM